MRDTIDKYRNNASVNDDQDKHLLRKLQQGDDTVFEIIYKKYINQLLSYGVGLGFRHEIIKDAIHDVFYKIFTKKKYLENITNLKAYLFRSLKNSLLNSDKAKRAETISESNEYNFMVEASVVDHIISDEDRKHVESKIESYLNCLTSRQREAVYLRFIQEMDYNDIANLLEMSPKAARKLVSRGILRIRNKNIINFLILISVFS